MNVPFLRTIRVRLLPLAGLALLWGCRDAPTVPKALQQFAGGEEWAAVTLPERLPGVATWLPYIDRAAPGSSLALARIEELEGEARAAESAGQTGRAEVLRREAERVAVVSITRTPPPVVLFESLAAIDLWSDRVREDTELDRAPELARSLRSVESAYTAASASLTVGDTASAIRHLSGAADRIRGHAPEAVALRVLGRVEARLASRPERDASGKRALHLIRSARHELIAGDPRRALRRALYALQIADGKAILDAPAEPLGPCGERGC